MQHDVLARRGKIGRKGGRGEEEAHTEVSHQERVMFLRTDQMKLRWLLTQRTTFQTELRSEFVTTHSKQPAVCVFVFLACRVSTDSSCVLEVAGNRCVMANTNKLRGMPMLTLRKRHLASSPGIQNQNQSKEADNFIF